MMNSSLLFNSLAHSPFHLNEARRQWVQATFAALSNDEKIGQTLLPLLPDLEQASLDAVLRVPVGGVFRMHQGPLAPLQQSARYLQAQSKLPLLMPGDLEYVENGAIGQGAMLSNQLALAATHNTRLLADAARIAALEGRNAGYNWSFSPIVDLSIHPRNPIVCTRSFGSDPQQVAELGVRYIASMQQHGMAACAKHWPGDGMGDTDQHLLLSENPLSFERWQETYGAIYRRMIDGGVLSVMSAHISLPSVDASGAPASLSAKLNLDLLREQLGFAGVIVSDASTMAGMTSQAKRAELVAACIENGCDILLFPEDVEADFNHLKTALREGRLSQQRLDAAVLRILALKAALGLAETRVEAVPFDAAAHAETARDIAQGCLTLLRDDARILPLSPQKTPRVLLIQPQQRDTILGHGEKLQIESLLQAQGFAVTPFTTGMQISPALFDLVIVTTADEAALCKAYIGIDWQNLQPGLHHAMQRFWHDIPTVFISLGNPYQAQEVAQCPTVILGYCPSVPIQEALVQALMGNIPFLGKNPVRLDIKATVEF
jgi:beta-N-acetylhexosaminidase